jgi:hypothetical protein
MARIFLAHRSRGEDPTELDYLLENISVSLECAGHYMICSLFYKDVFRKHEFSSEARTMFMLQRQQEADTFLAFVKSHDRSEGMLRESERAVDLGQRYVLAIKSGLHLPEYSKVAQEVITYDTYPELFERLKTFR